MRIKLISAALIAAPIACAQQEAVENGQDTAFASNAANGLQPGTDITPPPESGALPDDRDLVSDGPIDPKSAQGAAQVLQSYAALLEQRRFADARRLWSDSGRASQMSEEDFARSYGKYAELHAEIGAPGPMEGAAGSAYVEIPLRLYGRLKDGKPFNSTGTATLRRSNDVPGSTEEQRQWRIYRMDMQPPP